MEKDKFYHIFNRGVNGQPIFFEERNYSFFLKRLDMYLSDFIDLYSYCLMPNHFHLFFKVREIIGLNRKGKMCSIEIAFKHLFMSYAKAINETYGRTGSLFQQNYRQKEVDNDAYFSWIIQYIHMNPVKAGLCNEPAGWRYSSYSAIISNKPTKLKREEVVEWFGNINRFEKIHKERVIDFNKIESYLFGKKNSSPDY